VCFVLLVLSIVCVVCLVSACTVGWRVCLYVFVFLWRGFPESFRLLASSSWPCLGSSPRGLDRLLERWVVSSVVLPSQFVRCIAGWALL